MILYVAKDIKIYRRLEGEGLINSSRGNCVDSGELEIVEDLGHF